MADSENWFHQPVVNDDAELDGGLKQFVVVEAVEGERLFEDGALGATNDPGLSLLFAFWQQNHFYVGVNETGCLTCRAAFIFRRGQLEVCGFDDVDSQRVSVFVML